MKLSKISLCRSSRSIRIELNPMEDNTTKKTEIHTDHPIDLRHSISYSFHDQWI